MIAAVIVGSASIAAGFTGFGFNLVAVPLLALVVLPRDAVIIALLLGFVVSGSLALLAARRREIDYRLMGLLTLGSLPGLIAGTLLFRHLDSGGLRTVIGAITALCALLLLIHRAPEVRPTKAPATLGVGVVSGALAGATGTGGPPVVAYLMVKGAGGVTVRGTVLSQVALVSVLAVIAHAARGQVSSVELEQFVELVPAVVAGLAIGSLLFRRASPAAYRHVATMTLLLAGIVGVVMAVR